jgi:anti-sigma factor NepR-like protein
VQQTKKPTFSKSTDEAWRDWSYTKDHIGQQLKAYYQACTSEELPPRLVALLKKLDPEFPENQNQ